MKAQLLLEIDLQKDAVGFSVTRMYGLKMECDSSKPVYAGNQLSPVREAILGVLKDLVQESIAMGSAVQRPAAGGFGDHMGKHLGDGIALQLECGHPNVQPGQSCPICGVLFPVPTTVGPESV